MSVPAVDRVLPDATVEPAAGTHPCVAPAAGSGLVSGPIVPAADADPRHARLVELAEGIRELYPQARAIAIALIVDLGDERDEHTFYAPHYPGPPHVSIEMRGPLLSTFSTPSEFAGAEEIA
jgi:hypothetical protein